ncbi:hypothetical protein Vadar_028011 [Vaccinium darrowii]|uniref:Uncharacterized protein n=1 Tax=Vaccinium darrowii TaxID=229202 RepID=A0ACB7XTU1_9ERIC|nr:hypothetical protein Vadar_028011 [Vaccinium darrowii]
MCFAKLVVLVLKFAMGGHGPNKLILWPKILSVTGSNLKVLIAFANAFHVLQPLKVPLFRFSFYTKAL